MPPAVETLLRIVELSLQIGLVLIQSAEPADRAKLVAWHVETTEFWRGLVARLTQGPGDAVDFDRVARHVLDRLGPLDVLHAGPLAAALRAELAATT